GASLNDASLVRAKLAGANLSEASVVGAWLSEADLTGADLRGADLRRATLTNSELRSVVYDRRTRWPAQLERVGHPRFEGSGWARGGDSRVGNRGVEGAYRRGAADGSAACKPAGGTRRRAGDE